MILKIRRPDGSVEHVEHLGDRDTEDDIIAALEPLADVFAGSGFHAVVVVDGTELHVGTFTADAPNAVA